VELISWTNGRCAWCGVEPSARTRRLTRNEEFDCRITRYQ